MEPNDFPQAGHEMCMKSTLCPYPKSLSAFTLREGIGAPRLSARRIVLAGEGAADEALVP
jgi:hypothetical protein